MEYKTSFNKVQFQFHKGTIRTTSPLQGQAGQILFQFHKGTIRTLHAGDFRSHRKYHFNSIKVRLELALYYLTLLLTIISIP